MSNVMVIMPENGEQVTLNTGLIKFDITEAAIAEMRERYMSLKIDGINDKHGFNIVHEARMDVKGKRIAVDKKTKELNEHAVIYINSVKGEQKRIKELLAPIEDYLDSEETRIEDARETLKREATERENRRIQERLNKLSAYGYGVDYNEIKNCSDISFNALLEEAKEMHEKDIATKAEAERLRKEEDERLRIEREELEQLRKQQAYEANIAKAEQIRIQKEQEARERAIKAEQDKIDAEKKAADLQKQKEEEKKRAAALRPDKEKLEAFVNDLSTIEFPLVQDKKAILIIQEAKARIENIKTYILNQVKDFSVIIAAYDNETNATIIDDGKVKYTENNLITVTG